jgi:formate C-acetyltransferase
LGLEKQFGSIHNIYLTNVDNEDKKHKIIDLVDAYHSRGGHHLQINCIDKETLLNAQKHPENHPTLMVRVAGYVAYFVDLSKEVQDYIIRRTSVNL